VGRLRLHGERRAEEHDRYRTEIRYGSFDRVLTLPAGTKPEDVTAEHADGVLTVSMPAATTPARQEPTPDPNASQAADALGWPEEHLTGIVGAPGGRAISDPTRTVSRAPTGVVAQASTIGSSGCCSN
jgi:hypothetical protein